MTDECLGKHLLLGALAGLAGTMVMQVARTASQKALPQAEAPIRGDPGKFMVEKTKQALPERARQKIPQQLESAAVKSLAIGYGMTYGALYAAVRPQGGKPVRDGIALGLANWAIGYLGWLPKTGLMPPVWEHEPRQIAMPIAQHAIYGAATVAAYDWMLERF